MDALLDRSRLLLHTARFMTLATLSAGGEPWASTVNYVCRAEPLKLIWYSMRDALHSRNLEAGAVVSGSISRYDLGAASPIGLDGAQFVSECRVLDSEEAHAAHRHYYERNFPDELVRRQWMLPIEEFVGTGHRRFYEATITRWWLFDIERWLRDKQDRRVEVPLSTLAAAWAEI